MNRNWMKTVGMAVSLGIIGLGTGLGVYAGGLAFGASSGKAPAVTQAAAPAVAKIAAAQKVTRHDVRVAVARKLASQNAVYVVATKILTGSMDHRNGPEYAPAYFALPANATVQMTVQSFDDGPAPAPGYTTIRGTVGGVIEVDGKTVRSVPANDITHTFTVPALGLNVPIPAAPKGGSVTVTFTFHTGAPGTYTWQCYAECGNGPDGWGYPMTTPGMMTGTVTVR